MSECIKVDGEKVYLGCCADLTSSFSYDTLKKLADENRLAELPGNDSVQGYLNPKHHYQYRFPFLPYYEELKQFREQIKEDPVVIEVEKGFLAELHHRKIQKEFKVGQFGGMFVNLICPQDPKADYEVCNDTGIEKILIIGEEFSEGELITIFECAYCGARFTCSQQEIQAIKELLIKKWQLNKVENSFQEKWNYICNRLNGSK